MENIKCWTKERTSNRHTSWRTAGAVNLALLFCPVVVVQSCMPGWACHSRGHWAHHSTILKEPWKCRPTMSLWRRGHKNQMLRRADGSLKLNLSDLIWIQKWYHPGRKNGAQVGVLFYHYIFFSLFMGSESTFSYYSSPFLKTLPDSQRQKTGTAFWSSWFVSTACTGSQRRKEERKDCEQPRNVPRCMLLAGQAIAF